MSSELAAGQVKDPDFERRRAALLVPSIVATCISVPLLVTSILVHVVAQVLIHSNPDWLPGGMTYIPSSTFERATILVEQAVPVLVAFGMLLVTWRFRQKGRRNATCLCAVATVLLAAASLR